MFEVRILYGFKKAIFIFPSSYQAKACSLNYDDKEHSQNVPYRSSFSAVTIFYKEFFNYHLILQAYDQLVSISVVILDELFSPSSFL